jgi:hypothetical protein
MGAGSRGPGDGDYTAVPSADFNVPPVVPLS